MKRHNLSAAAGAAVLALAGTAGAQSACDTLEACYQSAMSHHTLSIEAASGPPCGGGVCLTAEGERDITVPLPSEYRMDGRPLHGSVLMPRRVGQTLPAVVIPANHGSPIPTPPESSTIAVFFYYDPSYLAADQTYALVSLADAGTSQSTTFAIGFRNNQFLVGQNGPDKGYWQPLWDPAPIINDLGWVALFIDLQADGKLLLSAYQAPPPALADTPVRLSAGLLDAGWPVKTYPAGMAAKPYLPATNLVLGASQDGAALGAPTLPGFQRLSVFGQVLTDGERGAVMAKAMPAGAFAQPAIDFDAPDDTSGRFLKAYLPVAIPDGARQIRVTNAWRPSPTASLLAFQRGAQTFAQYGFATPDGTRGWWHDFTARPPGKVTLKRYDPTAPDDLWTVEDLGLNNYRLIAVNTGFALTNRDGVLIMDTAAETPGADQTWQASAPLETGPPPAEAFPRENVTFMSTLDGQVIGLSPDGTELVLTARHEADARARWTVNLYPQPSGAAKPPEARPAAPRLPSGITNRELIEDFGLSAAPPEVAAR